MTNIKKQSFLKRPILSGAAAIALGFAAFGAGQVLSPHNLEAQAIRTQVPKAAAALPSFADLVENVSPAVVSIEVTQSGEKIKAEQEKELKGLPPELRKFFEGQGGGSTPRDVRGGGSGFFISQNGHIVTNNHVIENAKEITVTLKDGRELKAKVIGKDERTDLAVVKVEGNNFKYVQFEANAKVRVGDWVVAIGSPFGLGGTATAGIVSALGRDNVGQGNIADFIQIDAPINPGNSGGPTFDMAGRVIGVNTAIFSRSGGNDGIGFAIPANIVQRVTTQLMSGGQVTYGWLGVAIQDVSSEMADSFGLPNSKGALIGSVTKDSPALKAGLKRGEVVLSMDGQQVQSASDLTRRIGQVRAGETIRLEVVNGEGKKRVVNVTIAPRPSEEQLAKMQTGSVTEDVTGEIDKGIEVLGMALSPLTPQAKQKLRLNENENGLVISGIDEDSEAYKRGVREGDAILEINGATVSSKADFEKAIEAAKKANRSSVGIYLQRAVGGSGYIPLPIK